MPPATKKDLCLIVFDTHSSEKEKLLDGLLRISTYKQVAGTNDVFRLILANTKSTKNDLNYPNVFLTGVNYLNPEDVEACIKNTESKEGDWLDAILVGIHYLEQCIEMAGVITLQLIYFTTLDNTSELDNSKVEEIIEKLKEFNIYFYIVGPNIQLPSTITSHSDLADCMKQLEVDESNPSFASAMEIVKNTNKSVICPLNVGLHLLFSFKEPRGSQPWKVPLSFGTQLSLSANTSKIYRNDQVLRLSKHSQSKTSRYVLAEDESVEVKFHETVKGILRHGKFVEAADNKKFQVQGERSFDVLGFTEAKFVPDAYIIGSETYSVLPNEAPQDNYELFCSLVHILSEQNKYIIARRIYFNNCKPRYYVLIPQPEKLPPQFLMAGLPFADDIRVYDKVEQPDLPHEKLEDDLLQFCQSLDISDKNNEALIALSPNMMTEWYTNKLVSATAGKFLNREFEFCETDYVGTDSDSKFVEDLKASWPEQTE